MWVSQVFSHSNKKERKVWVRCQNLRLWFEEGVCAHLLHTGLTYGSTKLDAEKVYRDSFTCRTRFYTYLWKASKLRSPKTMTLEVWILKRQTVNNDLPASSDYICNFHTSTKSFCKNNMITKCQRRIFSHHTQPNHSEGWTEWFNCKWQNNFPYRTKVHMLKS